MWNGVIFRSLWVRQYRSTSDSGSSSLIRSTIGELLLLTGVNEGCSMLGVACSSSCSVVLVGASSLPRIGSGSSLMWWQGCTASISVVLNQRSHIEHWTHSKCSSYDLKWFPLTPCEQSGLGHQSWFNVTGHQACRQYRHFEWVTRYSYNCTLQVRAYYQVHYWRLLTD
jgi:hypothetical protein